jgi:hypothetical protein
LPELFPEGFSDLVFSNGPEVRAEIIVADQYLLSHIRITPIFYVFNEEIISSVQGKNV